MLRVRGRLLLVLGASKELGRGVTGDIEFAPGVAGTRRREHVEVDLPVRVLMADEQRVVLCLERPDDFKYNGVSRRAMR